MQAYYTHTDPKHQATETPQQHPGPPSYTAPQKVTQKHKSPKLQHVLSELNKNIFTTDLVVNHVTQTVEVSIKFSTLFPQHKLLELSLVKRGKVICQRLL